MSITYEYKCEHNHWVESKMSLTTCPARVHGHPCLGALTRIGRGSRTPDAEPHTTHQTDKTTEVSR